jgi:uncharacterized membrane protein
MMDSAPSPVRQLALAGFLLGFGLGGFFDGILLHQVLQWHHLLSGLTDARRDVRFLVMADGLFHIFMYVITAVGLWFLWRARRDWSMPGGDRSLASVALIGFGAWHTIDALLSHWLLGLHRVRMDTEAPLLWDLLWVVVFGIMPLTTSWLLQRGRPKGHRLLISPIALVLAVLIAAPIAAVPSPQQTTVVVLFRPDVRSSQAAAAIGSAGGSIVWVDSSNQLWAVDFSRGGDPTMLYLEGALMVSRSFLPAGCFGWVKA